MVPLFFIATKDEKLRNDGQPADYTFEHSVIRNITSLRDSINFYGEPRFLNDGLGNQHHGDARNEYGLLALNQYLGIGSSAFVVRANVNLDDSVDAIQNLWDERTEDGALIVPNIVQNYLNGINSAAGLTQPGFSVLTNKFSGVVAGAGQTQVAFDGTAPNGSFVGGNATLLTGDYEVGDVITLDAGMVITVNTVVDGDITEFEVTTAATAPVIGTTLNQVSVVDSGSNDVTSARIGASVTLGIANVVPAFLQSTSDFTFTPGTGYVEGEVITLMNAATVRVLAVDGTGAVTEFVLLTTGTFVSDGQIVAQASSTGVGTAFDVTVATTNLQELKETVNAQELKDLMRDATQFIFDDELGTYSFRNSGDDFFTARPVGEGLPVFPDGFDQPASTEEFLGFDGNVDLGTSATSGTIIDDFAWTPEDAGALFVDTASTFKFTQIFLIRTSLGANDAARRVSIVSALQEQIVSNEGVRAENFQFNVVAAPGYPEIVDELLALSDAQENEVFVIGDTPPNLPPAGITNPTNGWAISSERQNNQNVAYYYPWCLTSNLDGVNVLAAPSGVAIRQFAFSDDISFLWIAPAGTTRGLVTGVTDVGYATGVLGGATSFTPVALNQGQRDALYQDNASGRINPIVFAPGRGITLMGQKTSSPEATALNRINVVRLVMHIRRQLRLTMVGFLFEPNDQRTRDNVKSLADNFLSNIMTNRGITDFLTVCDSSNNPAIVVERSELIIDIMVKPTKAVEFITIPIRITTQDASF